MSKRFAMSEEKSKRIAIGATIGGVILVIVLIAIIVIQFVQMGVRRRRLNELEDVENRLQQEIEDGEYDLQRYDDEFMHMSALIMGYVDKK